GVFSEVKVAFSPDGSKALTFSSRAIKLWKLENGKRLASLKFQEDYGWVTNIAFSPDGTKILIGFSYSTAQLWTITDQKPLFTFSENCIEGNTSVAFSPDGTKIL